VKDQFNETYFTLAKSMIEKGAQYGLNFLLDVHQDVMSPKFCGEGVPDWVVDVGSSDIKFPEPVSLFAYVQGPNGYPSIKNCSLHFWSKYYLADATGTAFQNLYNNASGLLDQFAEYWAKIATEFKTYSNILGYEIMNEPWPGDIYRHPTLLVPGQADKQNLAHVYDVVSYIIYTSVTVCCNNIYKVSKAIWDVDPCHNVYFEPVTWDEWTVGFDTVPGGTSNSHRSVLSYHFYVPPDISSVISFYYIVKDLNKLGSAGFLTEFYASSSNTEKVLDEADSHLQSWMAWEMSVLYYDNRTLNTQVVSSLSRSYPQAVAGITNTFSYNKETHKFSLVYTLTKDCTSNVTEIYINEEMHYSKGYDVDIKPVNAIKWYSPSRNRIIVTHNPSLSPGTKIQVDITSV
jgi:endoglycosylceramidase